MKKRALAFDLGASGGRAMLGYVREESLVLEEVHRFSNGGVWLNGVLYWDFLYLWNELQTGILKAKDAGGFDSIAIDTWGVDFGVIDENGSLVSNPVHYRDTRTDGIAPEVFTKISEDRLYEKTGIQFMKINTLYQLAALKRSSPALLTAAKSILMMPDLFAYFLTGKARSEYTIASTTNMLNIYTGNWDPEIVQAAGIDIPLLPDIIYPGEIYGMLSGDICAKLNIPSVPVVAVASHDTAAAVAASGKPEGGFAFISCGTWSLLGAEISSPVINKETRKSGFSNEGGFANTTCLLKNIPGLWFIQESRRQWEREGITLSYAQIADEAGKAPDIPSVIDPVAPEFALPGDLPGRIREYCRQTGQIEPGSRGELIRCVYQSLALEYRRSFEQLKKVTQNNYNRIYMFGGGIKDELLCQMAADACQAEVVAGHAEATAAGNAAIQLISLGELENIEHARRIIQNSTETRIYTPEASGLFELYPH